MTEERRAELEEKLNMAEASGDPAQVSAIKKTMEQEYRLCTSHTASRLKRVENTVNEIKDGLIPANMFSEMKEGMVRLADAVGELKIEVASLKRGGGSVKDQVIMWLVKGLLIALGIIATSAGAASVLKPILGM